MISIGSQIDPQNLTNEQVEFDYTARSAIRL